jgi:uncharacterized protein involved in exopolysaccharide biosynthesis
MTEQESKSAVVGYFIPAAPTSVADALGWEALVRVLWTRKFLIGFATVFSGLLCWGLGAFVAKAYRAEAIVAIVEQEGAVSTASIGGQLGRLASLAGVNLGGGASNRQELVAFLSSRTLYGTYIAKEQLLPVLFSSRWDATAKKWKSGGGLAALPPSLDEGVEQLRRRVFGIKVDRDSGLIHISAEHANPETAAKLVNALIATGNFEVKTRVSAEAAQSLQFLNSALIGTQDVETRQLIAQLMQRQLSSRMLASVRAEYAYKVIDPAFVPGADRFVKPRRAVYAAIGMFCGLLVASLWAIWRSKP